MKAPIAGAILLTGLAISDASAQTATTPAPTAPAAPSQAAPVSAPTFITEQPAGEWLAGRMIGEPVKNAAGETIGDINDLLVDKGGKISAAVLGVGGFLGMGEKEVAVPFGSIAIATDAAGKRTLTVGATREALAAAPAFRATEKSLLDKAAEKARELGKSAAEKAGELRDQAGKQIEEMRRDDGKRN